MSDVDLFLIQAQLDIDRAFSDVDAKSRTLYAQQRQLLFEHQSTLKTIEEQNRRGSEDSQKHARRTREEMGYLAKQIDEVKRKLVEALSIGAVAEFTRRSVESFATFDRAMRTTQEMLNQTREQIEETKESLEKLEARSGMSAERIAPFMRNFRRDMEGLVPDAKKLFETSFEAADLLGAKISDTNAIIETCLRLWKRPVTEVEQELSHLTQRLGETGGAFAHTVPQLQRMLDAHNITQRDAVTTLTDYQRISQQTFGGNFQEAATKSFGLVQKILDNPHYAMRIEQANAQGKSVKDIIAMVLNEMRDFDDFAHPDRLRRQGFGDEDIAQLKDWEKATDRLGNVRAEFMKKAETVDEQFTKKHSDTLGKIDEIAAASKRLMNTWGELGTEFAKPYFDPLISGADKLNKILKDMAPKPAPESPGHPIPGLAEGGIVTSPTVAMVGEKGPEAVIPMADVQRAQARDEAEMARGQAQQSQKDAAESATVDRLHQLALLGRDRRPPFRDWDNMLKGQDTGGGGGGGGGGDRGWGPGSGTSSSDSDTPKSGDGKPAGGPGAGGPKGPVDKDGNPLFPTPEQHPQGAAGIPGLPGSPSGPALTPEQRKAAATGAVTTAGWQPDPNTKKGMIGPRNEAQSDYLKAVRKAAADEVAKDPQLRAMLRGIGHAEDGKDPAAPLEALLGRWQYQREHGHPDITLRQMFGRTGKGNSFFGPIANSGAATPYDALRGDIASANRDQKRFDNAIDYVLGGSNRLRGYYDQGGYGDPNYEHHVLEEGDYEPPRGAHGREGYGLFPGSGRGSTHELPEAIRWREAQQKKVLGGGGIGSGSPAEQVARLGSTAQIQGAPGGPSGPALTHEQRVALGTGGGTAVGGGNTPRANFPTNAPSWMGGISRPSDAFKEGLIVEPRFPVRKGVNLKGMDPELIARFNKMWDEAPDSAKQAVIKSGKGFILSGARPATRAEAKAMGLPEGESQEAQWEWSNHGRKYAAAPPNFSMHQFGEAGDMNDPNGYFHKVLHNYDLNTPFPKRDQPHTAMKPGTEGKRYAPTKAAAATTTAENTKPPADKSPPPPPAPQKEAAGPPLSLRKKMAEGGVVKERTDVTLGEDGPEAVVPLGDNYHKMLEELGAPIRPEIEAPRPPTQQRLYAAQRRASQQQEHWTSKAEHRYHAHNSHADIGPT